MELSREQIIRQVIESIKDIDYANAAWEVGAAAFDRVDEWSDVDIVIDCEDCRSSELFTIIEKGFTGDFEIELKFTVPFPEDHDYQQKFYRFKNAGKFRVLDLAILRTSAKEKFLEKEIHNNVKVFFDKKGITHVPPVNRADFADKVISSLSILKNKFEMFHVLVEKEFYRGNELEAVYGYQSFILPVLNTLIRVKENPYHFDFKARYLHYELNQVTLDQFIKLHYFSDFTQLKAHFDEAVNMIRKLFEELDENRTRRIVEKFQFETNIDKL